MFNKRPMVVVVGAPKCGTTSLYYYLKQSPQVYLPAKKELHFFSRQKILEKMNGPGDRFAFDGCPKTLEEYLACYSSAPEGSVSLDISPSYFSNPESFSKIRDDLGAVKILIILRNPIEKAFSQYMHLVRESRETLPFLSALEAENERKRKGFSEFWWYKESSIYTPTVQSAFDVFGRKNCLLLFQEDMTADLASVMRTVCQFLGVDSFDLRDAKEANKSGVPRSRFLSSLLAPGFCLRLMKMIIPHALGAKLKGKLQDLNTGEKLKMSEKERSILRNYFERDVWDLETLLDVDVPWSDFH